MNAKIVNGMKSIFGSDQRRIDHSLEVLKYACIICDEEYPGDSSLREIVEMSAVLHDIGIKQAEAIYNSAAPVHQHREGPPIAQNILKNAKVDDQYIARVLYIIGHHHLKSKINGPDFQVLWESDLIVNIPYFPIYRESFDKYKKMIANNFKTRTGTQIALGLYK